MQDGQELLDAVRISRRDAARWRRRTGLSNLDRDDKGNSLVSSHANGYIIQVGRPKKRAAHYGRCHYRATILDLCHTAGDGQGLGWTKNPCKWKSQDRWDWQKRESSSKFYRPPLRLITLAQFTDPSRSDVSSPPQHLEKRPNKDWRSFQCGDKMASSFLNLFCCFQ